MIRKQSLRTAIVALTPEVQRLSAAGYFDDDSSSRDGVSTEQPEDNVPDEEETTCINSEQ